MKAILITGCSSGIGKSSALELARAEFEVFAAVRKASDAAALMAEAGRRLRIRSVLLDVTDRDSIAAAVRQVADAVSGAGLCGLVNVAGVGLSGPLEYTDLDFFRRVFEVNVFGQLALIQAALPLLRTARGRIVNISSVGAHIAIPFGGALTASKSAFGSLSDALRLELAPFGVRVCTIEPGSIKTPAVEKTLGAIEQRIAQLPPDGASRYGSMFRAFTQRALAREENGSPPGEVAKAVLHALTAARPRIRYVVGKDARLLVTLPRLLPDRILDRLRTYAFGLPAEFGALARSGGDPA